MSRFPEDTFCVVIAGGDVREKIEIPEDALVVCADCGYRHALAQGIVPDVIVGDFDSWTEPLPEDVALVKHPPEKDDTDTWLAIEYGRSKGHEAFLIYGAFGGERIDHAIANIQLLSRMVKEDVYGYLRYGNQEVRLFDTTQSSSLEIRKKGLMFSVFSMTDVCTDVNITGAKYPLEHAELRSSYPLGISNEVTAEKAVITAKTGALLIVITLEQSPNP